MVSPYLIRPLRSLCEALKPGQALSRARPDLANAQPSGAQPSGAQPSGARPARGSLGGAEAEAARLEMMETP